MLYGGMVVAVKVTLLTFQSIFSISLHQGVRDIRSRIQASHTARAEPVSVSGEKRLHVAAWTCTTGKCRPRIKKDGSNRGSRRYTL